MAQLARNACRSKSLRPGMRFPQAGAGFGHFLGSAGVFRKFPTFFGIFFGTTTAALKQPEKSPGHLLHRQSAARAVLMQPMQRRTDDAKSALHRLHGPSCAAKSCRHSVLLRAGGRKSWLQASTRRLPPRNRPGIRCRAALPGRNLPCTRCMPVRTKASPPCNRCTADLRRKIQVARNEMSDRPQKKIACSGVMAKSPLQLFVAFVARKIPHEKIGRAFAARKIPHEKIGRAFVATPTPLEKIGAAFVAWRTALEKIHDAIDARPILRKKSAVHRRNGPRNADRSARHSRLRVEWRRDGPRQGFFASRIGQVEVWRGARPVER